MKLKDSVAIVTGGSRDIGRSVSVRLAREGAKVAVNYFSDEKAGHDTLKQIQDEGGQAILVKGDMTKEADVANLVAEAQTAFGNEIHTLVNVVGGLVARKNLDEMDEDFFNKVMHLNLNPVFLSMKAVVPHMREGASVINLSSQAGRDGGGPGASVYAASKGAVSTFTRGMAKELGPRGIRVNALCPGMIATSFHDTFTKDEVREKVAGSTPLRRQGHPDEVADVVAYMASKESSFLTGVNLDVNGGLLFS